jgi:hypothetical protein
VKSAGCLLVTEAWHLSGAFAAAAAAERLGVGAAGVGAADDAQPARIMPATGTVANKLTRSLVPIMSPVSK